MEDKDIDERLTPGEHPVVKYTEDGVPPIQDAKPCGRADAVIFLGRKIGASQLDKRGFPKTHDWGREKEAYRYLRPGDERYMLAHGLKKGMCQPNGWRVFATPEMLAQAESEYRTLEALFCLWPHGIFALDGAHVDGWTWHEVEDGIWAGLWDKEGSGVGDQGSGTAKSKDGVPPLARGAATGKA